MDKLNEAEKLLKAKNYQNALALYLNITQKNPNNALAQQGIAQCQYGLGQYAEALKTCEKVIEIEPSFATPHTILAFIYGRSNDLREASKEAKIALELNPDSFEALDCYGTILLAEGRYNEAISFLRQAIQKSPTSLPTHSNLAMAYEKKADMNGYLEEVKAIFRIRPSIQNGFRFLLILQRRYALPISVLITGILLASIILRMKVLLMIPSLYLIWGGQLSYQFVKARRWRSAVTFTVATIVYAGLLYIIYRIIVYYSG